MSSKVLNIEIKICYDINLTKEGKRLKTLEILDRFMKSDDDSIERITITIPSSGEIYDVGLK